MSECKLLCCGGYPHLSPIKFRYKKGIKGLVISRESMFEDMDTCTGLFNLEILKEPEVREDQLTW